jgi:hypothetical protein
MTEEKEKRLRAALIQLMSAMSALFDQPDIRSAIDAAPPDLQDLVKNAIGETYVVLGPLA